MDRIGTHFRFKFIFNRHRAVLHTLPEQLAASLTETRCGHCPHQSVAPRLSSCGLVPCVDVP